MGFHVEINSILRSDLYATINRGDVLPFIKQGSRIFFDDIPIWLTRSDWTALAEIRVLSQTRTADSVKGDFEVLHVYEGNEQHLLTDTFRRMYADAGNKVIYFLMTAETLKAAQLSGTFAPESLKTEGFIHASPANQLTRVANKYYAEHEMVFVVACRKSEIQSPIKWEPATGGLYPHVFGALNMDSVVDAIPVFRSEDRTYSINL